MYVCESVCERVWVLFLMECCFEGIIGKLVMVKVGEVGEKGRVLCFCCLDFVWYEEGSLVFSFLDW